MTKSRAKRTAALATPREIDVVTEIATEESKLIAAELDRRIVSGDPLPHLAPPAEIVAQAHAFNPAERSAHGARWMIAVKQLEALRVQVPLAKMIETARGQRETEQVLLELRDEIRELVASGWASDPVQVATMCAAEQLYENHRQRFNVTAPA